MAAVRLSLLAGAGVESGLESGLCHALEHVYLRQILEGPSRDKLRPGNIGQYELNGETGEDHVTFTWRGPEEFLPIALDALTTTLLKGEIPDQETLDRESIRLRTDVTLRTEDMRLALAHDLCAALFPGSTASTQVTGTGESLVGLEVAALQVLLREKLLPSGACISLVGGSPDLASQLISDTGLAREARGTEMSKLDAILPQDIVPGENSIYFRKTRSKLATVGFAFPSLPATDQRAPYTALLRRAMLDLLEEKLVNERLLTYNGPAPLVSDARSSGFHGGTITCLPEKVFEVIGVIRDTARMLSARELPPDYFSHYAAAYLKNNVLNPSQSALGAAHFTEELVLGKIGFNDFTALADYTRAMTSEGLRKVAAGLLSPNSMGFVVYAPALEPALFDPVSVVTLPNRDSF